MPALVVWEPLIFAGDDLRLISTLILLLRLVQISMVIYVVYHIIKFDHKPEFFVETDCLGSEENYWIWYNTSVVACFFTLAYGIIGALIEVAMYQVSGRGTPTETEVRNALIPLCKCNMVPMFLMRVIGFTFAVVALNITDKFCNCAYNALPEFERERRRRFSNCPTDDRTWWVAARLLIFTMACDAFFPMITLIVVLRKRIHNAYRRLRPREERTLEDVERSWRLKCQMCCECCSLMTCYMFGGQNLTAGSYADVAMALTDFVDGDGSLDIVPSDVAAALICLVNQQKQKQLDCKNELVREGGLFAKDRKLATKLWRQFMRLESTTDVPVRSQSESMRKVSASLKRSLSLTSDDIETGGVLSIDDETNEMIESVNSVVSQSTLQPTDTELENLRQMILTRRDTMAKIDFRLVHRDSSLEFEPTYARALSPENAFDCLVLGEGSRYCAVALASYSWMMYVWTNKCTGCCELTADSLYGVCTCQPRCCRSNDKIIGSDIVGWKEATVLKSLGIEESDLLYANFLNEVGVNPYMILRDRKWKTIVLTVRGTLSFEDMISDVTVTPVSLEKIGEKYGFDGQNEYAHSGMLSGAQFIYDDLQTHKILHEAMKEHPDYGLRIIGHSLGAGVSAILGLMLRQQFPNLYCLCFSPPGCVFSERTAKESKDYACSYVLHNDIVPRLSYNSLVNFRNDLIEMVARIKVPKHKVFDSNYTSWNEKSLPEFSDKLLHDRESIPTSKFINDFEQFKRRQSDRQQERIRPDMVIPGRIMHMIRTSAKLNNVPCGCMLSCMKCIVCCGTSQTTKKYKVRWIHSDDLSQIYISPTMMSDHFPYNVSRALEICTDAYAVEDQASSLHECGTQILDLSKKES